MVTEECPGKLDSVTTHSCLYLLEYFVFMSFNPLSMVGSAEVIEFSHHRGEWLLVDHWVFRLVSNFGVLIDHQAC